MFPDKGGRMRHLWWLFTLVLAVVASVGCALVPPGQAETPPHTLFLPYVTATPGVTSAPATWSIVYGGDGFEEMEGVVVTDDGGLVIVGATDSYGESSDGWVLKVDGRGRIQWQRTYGGNGEDSLIDIRQTKDGGFVAVGWTDSVGAGQADVWVLRLDVQGNVVWSKVYGGPQTEQGWSIALAEDGGYVVAGGTTSFGAGQADYWVLRLDGSGNVLWQKTLGGPGDDGGGGEYEELVVRVLVDRDGNYVVVGESTSFGTGESDIWVLKMTPQGQVLWQKAFGGEYEETMWSFAETASGGYIVPGVTVSYSPDLSGDVWVLHLNRDGTVRWQKVFGLRGYWDEALSVSATRDGGAVIGAYAEREGADWDWFMLRVDREGELRWQRRYEHGWDWPNAVAEMPDGSLVAVGVAWDRARGRDLDLWAMRLTADGRVGAACSAVQDIQVEARTTTAVPVDTNATVQDTRITPRAFPVDVRTSFAMPHYLCAGP